MAESAGDEFGMNFHPVYLSHLGVRASTGRYKSLMFLSYSVNMKLIVS
jgi:hypothetical protein